MPDLHPAARTSVLILALTALASCGGDRFGKFDWTGPKTAAQDPMQPGAPPVNLAGRWLLSSPGRGQCHMTFGAASPGAIDGTIAPEGGCPGKFFTSRKWTYDQGGLVMRDHNGQPLAQLSSAGSTFEGKATSGEPVTLLR
ncbi:MAG: hypothetical protein EXQ83_12850 [Xanthobacteraceae bacterium]|nr:hypothetical protein [Xanthobacteraceae bacterium]